MSIRTVALAAALALGAIPARADLTFTDQTSFLANVQPGYYLENFNTLPGYTDLGSPLSFSGNGFSYDAIAVDGVYTTQAIAGDVALSTFNSGQSLTIAFTGAPVTAVGGNIYGSDINGIYTPGAITMQLANGDSITLPDPTPTSFAGFITSSPIVSLAIFPENFDPGYWATLDNLIVGVSAVPAVPEPSTMTIGAVCGLAMLAFAFARSRRRPAPPVA